MVSKEVNERIKMVRKRIRLAASGDEAREIIRNVLYGPPPELMKVNPNAGIAM